MRENPPPRRRHGERLVQIPVTDIGIEIFAACLPVSTVGEDIELTLLTGVEV